jgi:hypothetical protein
LQALALFEPITDWLYLVWKKSQAGALISIEMPRRFRGYCRNQSENWFRK